MSPEFDNPASQSSAVAAAAQAERPPETLEAASEAPERQAEPSEIPIPVPANFSEARTTSEDAGAMEEVRVEGQATVEAGSPEATSEAESAAGAETPSGALDQLLEQYSAPQPAPAEGEILEGRVIAVTELGVVVDIGAKSEGLIPAQEFLESEHSPALEPSQAIEVQRLNEQKEGYILLSYQRARRRRAWERIEGSYRHRTPLTARVLDRIKGGLVVDLGVRAFLPASQVDMRPIHDLETWKGQEITCRVLKMNRKRSNVVVSRRAVLEEELQTQRQRLLDSLTEGQVLTGKVKNITDYGVFVDLGGVDGLLHITDLSWGRLKHPSEAVSPGEEIEVQVLRFDREKMRISLGRKQLLPDPWASLPEQFPIGSRVRGRVVGITDYGAFVELAPGLEGLVHVSEMSWSKRMKHPSKIVSLGDEVEVAVLNLEPEKRRISLGLKQTVPDPWQELAEKYPVGTIVTGRVRNLTDFGAFVEIEEGFDGLIHISDISWTERVKKPSEVFKRGDTVQARVLKVDPVNRRVSLGIKQVNDIWAQWFEAHKVSDIVRGRISRLTSFGAFVELAAGIEGLCHISEIEERGRKAQREPAFREKKGPLVAGQEYDFKVIKLNPEQHKIGLSYRAALKQAERREMEQYRSSKSSPTATIGDAILSKGEALPQPSSTEATSRPATRATES